MSPAHPAGEVLERLHDGQIEDAERASVEGHVRDCGDCDGRLADLTRVAGVLRELGERDAEAFDGDRVWARLAPQLTAPPSAADRFQRWLASMRPLHLAGGLAVAAAAVALLFPAGVEDNGVPPEVAPPAAVAVDNECLVDSVEAGEGDSVLIGRTAGSEGATVIWLLAADTGEGQP